MRIRVKRYGEAVSHLPSRFLSELPEDLVQHLNAEDASHQKPMDKEALRKAFDALWKSL